jgi:glycerol kinase
MRETTALGAAIAAGFAVGVWKDFAELKEINSEGRFYFKPDISEKKAAKMYGKWEKAVRMSKGWVDQDEEDETEEKTGGTEGSLAE